MFTYTLVLEHTEPNKKPTTYKRDIDAMGRPEAIRQAQFISQDIALDCKYDHCNEVDMIDKVFNDLAEARLLGYDEDEEYY